MDLRRCSPRYVFRCHRRASRRADETPGCPASRSLDARSRSTRAARDHRKVPGIESSCARVRLRSLASKIPFADGFARSWESPYYFLGHYWDLVFQDSAKKPSKTAFLASVVALAPSALADLRAPQVSSSSTRNGQAVLSRTGARNQVHLPDHAAHAHHLVRAGRATGAAEGAQVEEEEVRFSLRDR